MARSKSITKQLEEILDESVENIEKNSDDIFKQAAVETVNILHQVSPKQPYGSRSGQYARGWTYKPTETANKGYIVYNETDYELTHLLENGHALWNGTKRVSARKHIRPVEQSMITIIMSRLPHVTD